MPTTLSYTVDPDGTGEYTSFNAALAAKGTDYPVDLVGEDKALNFSLICSGGSADLGGTPQIIGFTVDSTHFVTAEVPTAYQSGGKYSACTGNVYRCIRTNGYSLDVQTNYTVVRGFNGIDNTGVNYGTCTYIEANDVLFDRCLFVNNVTATVGNSLGIMLAPAPGRVVYLRNVVTHKAGAAATYTPIYVYSGTGLTLHAHGCTLVSPNNVACNGRAGNTLIFKNCLLHGSTGDGDIGESGLSADSTNNAFFHGTAPSVGANWKDYTTYGMTSEAAVAGAELETFFSDPASGDYDPLVAVATKDGADLSSDTDLPVTEDITEAARATPPNIGAFEVGAASAPVSWEEADPSRVERCQGSSRSRGGGEGAGWLDQLLSQIIG